MSSARELFVAADLVLLDFDGPVTRLLPPPANAELADRARETCCEAGVAVVGSLLSTTDHLELIRAAGRHSPHALAVVEARCAQLETSAANDSPVTPGIDQLLDEASARGQAVTVVTNNSPECVEAFLVRHNLQAAVKRVIGRDPLRPDRMKPDPYVVMRGLEQPHTRAVMIGDSVTDVLSAKPSGTPTIGMAKSDERARELQEAGATAVVTSLEALISTR